MWARVATALAASAISGSPAAAQEGGIAASHGFDPRQPCGAILEDAGDIDKMMVAAWVFGYLGASTGTLRPVDLANNRTVLRNVIDACVRNPDRPLVDLVNRHQTPGPKVQGSEAHARKLLSRFLAPGVDRAALTATLKPSEADIRAVYADPLADRLVALYASMFKPGAAIGPKPGQTQLVTARGTTAQLKRGDAVLRDFPGGYDKVRPFFLGDQPIVRFKFVKPGESAGMAYDGLVFVHGRWVLMPKPWRGLG